MPRRSVCDRFALSQGTKHREKMVIYIAVINCNFYGPVKKN